MNNGEKKRVRLIFLFVIIIPNLAILIRLFSLQFLKKEELEDLARRIHIKEERLEEIRGTIYDRKGRELAVSIEVDSIYADPRKIVSKEVTARRLSNILNIDKGRLLLRFKSSRHFVWVKRKITPEERKKVLALKIDGIGFLKEYKRVYPKGELAGYLLGFVGLDNRGQEGVELYFDQYLRGKLKRRKILRDAKGNIVHVISGTEDSATFMGADIFLTIDEVIQHTAEVELKKVVDRFEAKRGLMVIMDPRSGEILALAIQPGLNPNIKKNSYGRNWVITDGIEPGSIFKPITFAAAIEEGVIDTKEKTFCPGFIVVANHKIRCHDNHKGLTFKEALEKSCNVGTIEVALRLEPKRFYEYIRSFGFGNITGITLPGEGRGHLRRPSSWSCRSQTTLAIGQEILVTPIQLAVAIASLANNGRLMEPLIVREIRDQKGRLIKEFRPTCIRQAVSAKTCESLKPLLEGVILRGTGKAAHLGVNYHVYGKTGTAQKFDKALDRYSHNKTISSFIGWVEDKKKSLLILTIIDEPKGIYWGSLVAAPSFKAVAKKILPYLGIFPEETILAKVQNPLDKVQKPHINPSQVMPDLLGMTMRDVHRLISHYELKLVFEGSGIVVAQTPLPGTELQPGITARIRLEGG